MNATALAFIVFSLALSRVTTSAANVFNLERSFKATSLFSVSANSTCGGDPPTTFVYNEQQFNCSTGEHHAGFLLDNDPSTWWQSDNGDDPVSITFSLEVKFRGRGTIIIISGIICSLRYP